MDNFTFYAPTYFDFGKGAEAHVADLIKKFGGGKVLLHYGGGSIKRSGLYDTEIIRIKASIRCGIGLEVKPNPRSGLVYEGIDLCKKEKGLTLSWQSAVEAPLTRPKQLPPVLCMMEILWIFIRVRQPLKKHLPIGTILTIAAAGSEGSPNTVITDEKQWLKKGDQKVICFVRSSLF